MDIHGYLIMALFYFMISILFGKMDVYCTRWLKEWHTFKTCHFNFETVVGK